MSTIQTNAIVDASGGNTTTVNGVTPLANTARFGRNLIINGDFQVNQRGNGSGVGNAGYIGVDRWRGYISTSSTLTFTQTAFANGQSDVDRDLRHYLRFDWLGTGAATSKLLSQHIDGVQKGNGQKVTVSFWGRTEQADDCVLQIHQHFGTGGSSGVDHISPTIDLTTSWQYFTHTFDLTSTSGKTIGANNSLRFEFLFGPATLNSYFEVTGVQVEVGDTATDFEHRTYEDQLAACQRYYYQIKQDQHAGQYTFMLGAVGGTNTHFMITNPQVMRAAPTVTYSGSVNLYNNATAISNPTGFGAYSGTKYTRIQFAKGTHVAGESAWADIDDGVFTFTSEL